MRVPQTGQASTGRGPARRSGERVFLAILFMTWTLVLVERHDKALVPQDHFDVQVDRSNVRLEHVHPLEAFE